MGPHPPAQSPSGTRPLLHSVTLSPASLPPPPSVRPHTATAIAGPIGRTPPTSGTNRRDPTHQLGHLQSHARPPPYTRLPSLRACESRFERSASGCGRLDQ
eukprot:519255-Prorocentrum_minimum.AAC.1